MSFVVVQRQVMVALWALLCLHQISTTCALFADEAGVSDFLVATSGHGLTRFVHASSSHAGEVLTSDSPIVGHQLVTNAPGTSCFVSSRFVETGALKWRRNVCSGATTTATTTSHHSVDAAEEAMWTMDASGVVRSWDLANGVLLWDALVSDTEQPRILVPAVAQPNAVGAVADNVMALFDATTGEAIGDPMNAAKVMKENGGSSSRGEARWLQILTDEKDKWQVLLGWVNERDEILTTSGSDLMVINFEWKDDSLQIAGSYRLGHIKQFDVSSLQLSSGKALALCADGKSAMVCDVLHGGNHCDISEIKTGLSWSQLTSISAMSDSVVRISGLDEGGKDKQALFQLPSWAPFQEQSGTFTATGLLLAECLSMTVALETEGSQVRLFKLEGATLSKVPIGEVQMETPSNILMSPTMTALGCVGDTLSLFLSTLAGTSSVLQVSGNATFDWKWTAEEGLGQVSSGLLLDASHAVVVDDLISDDTEQEPAEISRRLQFSTRLSSQISALVEGGMNLVSSSSTKDRLFGFLQVAALISQRTHRLYGMDLAGPKRGSVTWTIDLPQTATWHKLVHGTFNSPKGAHGIQGGTHAREVLLVSALPNNKLDWKCIDGTHGQVHTQGTLDVASPVTQILPVVGGGVCRQHAVLLHEDHSVSVVPEGDSSAQSALKHAVEASSNGLFAHVMSGTSGVAKLESYQIPSEETPARLVGQTSFPGEQLVTAVYPSRNEVVQSPCTVLGDDSLLLKYLNPHLAVMITVKDDASSSDDDTIDAILAKAKHQTDKKKKKKPLGVTPKPGSKPDDLENAASAKEEEPNLFVNVVDTVSGRVLHRVSHANAATSGRHIRAVISENWIVYSFVNAKTRKTEVGVISLYEGMIHRKGLTAFSSPEQTTEFSSWDARETKPVVLSKTYAIPSPVTALGVTLTRSGISSHQILFATNDDRIFAIQRTVLEPRRPLSELKDSEKQEGLRQYSELVPLISLQALSYNQTVEAPTHILSSPTELESQTLVFAFGGPDIFFARTSPSKGFDMLPDSFNRVLLSLLVVGLVSVVVVTKKMATKKMVKHGWI